MPSGTGRRDLAGLPDFDADPHLRLEHALGGPVARLAGWLQLLRDNEVTLEAAVIAMTKATLDLTLELVELSAEV